MRKPLLQLLGNEADSNVRGVSGVAIAIVTNNQDPDNQGKVKVKFPWLSNDHESWWARVAAPMAGKNRGTYFLPEVDDEVLVAFEHGDTNSPVVIGALWNGVDTPPENNSNGENNVRMIRSRSGHEIRLNDKNGQESIEIIDKTGKNKVLITSADSNIAISCEGTLSIEAREIRISSKTSVDLKANTTVDLKASAQMTIKGAMVNIN